MVNFQELTDQLPSQDGPEKLERYIKSTGDAIAAEICNGSLKMIDLVKGLNPVLTSGTHEIRAKGVKLLVHVIVQLPTNLLNEKEIETMTEFMCLRLIDHKSMEQPALRCLSHFVDCDNKPTRYNKLLVDFIKTKSNPHRMDAINRRRIYEILKKVIAERRRLSNVIDGDLIYSLVSILENENNPDNLLLCFGMISYILKNFSELEPYMDDIFEWLSAYYPVDYTPPETDDSEALNIQRSDLVEALYDCFYATPLNAENLQTMLLEKLESNATSIKLESLECLIKCYEQFPLSSIQKYNSTLWTAIRMNCLRKVSALDPKLMDTSLRTLTALAKKLSEDGDQYFLFISDMYEELAIAFRKPEMDLFDSAAKLLTHAILPSIVGFNYVLDKVLTTSINALVANECRPISGLAYIFKQLHAHHPDTTLKSELNVLIKQLLVKVLDRVQKDDKSWMELVEALVSHRVPLEEADLNEIITKLRDLVGKTDSDVEKCLALVGLNYKRSDIICHEEIDDFSLNSLIKLIHSFEMDELVADIKDTPTSSFPTSLSKLAVYLRLLTIEFDKSSGNRIDSIDQRILNQSLIRMRELASQLESMAITGKVALIHAIVLNKLDSQNVSKILMDIFSSNYCQKLVPAAEKDRVKTTNVYLPLIRSVFKSLTVRNHQLATPLINLFLNFITSDKVNLQLALEGTRVFSFVQSTDELSYDGLRHYQVFALYRQKFYAQSNKEIRVRYDKEIEDIKKDLLICTLALQIPHLPFAVYKRDYEWLVRQLLIVLVKLGSATGGERGKETEVTRERTSTLNLFTALFGCLENLIRGDLTEHLVNFAPSLIDLCLKLAQTAQTMQTRRQALICLARIAASFKDADLLCFRPRVVDGLRECLADKKRLVRQAAAEARLRWIVIGQPVGSN